MDFISSELVKTCAVIGCDNTSIDSTPEKPIYFYNFPENIVERGIWQVLIHRVNPDRSIWQPDSSSFVCSDHFLAKKQILIPGHSSYTPSLFPEILQSDTDCSNPNIKKYGRAARVAGYYLYRRRTETVVKRSKPGEPATPHSKVTIEFYHAKLPELVEIDPEIGSLDDYIARKVEPLVKKQDEEVAALEAKLFSLTTEADKVTHSLTKLFSKLQVCNNRANSLNREFVQEQHFVDVFLKEENGNFVHCGTPGAEKVVQKLSSDNQDVIPDRLVRLPSDVSGVAPAVSRPPLKRGDKVWALSGKVLSHFQRAVVLELVNPKRGKISFYKVRYEARSNHRVVHGTELAYAVHPTTLLPVGTRVICYFGEPGNTQRRPYSGTVAEPQKSQNDWRYLIFFDDGYAQYAKPTDLFVICEQSFNVWDDTHENMREFIREYVQSYPERPMLRVSPGQIVRCEWQGSWWSTKVLKVQCSLCHLSFPDGRTEWIYRGSLRLEKLFKTLKSGMSRMFVGRLPRRNVAGPTIEYLREAIILSDDDSEEVKKISPKKSDPSSSIDTSHVRKSSMSDDEDVLYADKPDLRGRHVAETAPRVSIFVRKAFVPHTCSSSCLDMDDDPTKLNVANPYQIPAHCGWTRCTSNVYKKSKKAIMYMAPCGRCLRNLDEVGVYLRLTNSKLTIDLFTYDVCVDVFKRFEPLAVKQALKDITYNREPVPIECVNSLDESFPPFARYKSTRFPARGVDLNLDPAFLSSCDCTDDCSKRSSCSCRQLSIAASDALTFDPKTGYQHRLLKGQVITGVFECYQNCKCSSRCVNRVAQNGIRVQLQLFKTEGRGWGVRCLHDLPQGKFICSYAGQLLTQQIADMDGNQFGDEYLAELDHMEVVESMKEGFERDVQLNSEDEEYFASRLGDGAAQGAQGGDQARPERKSKKRAAAKLAGIDQSDNSQDSVKSTSSCPANKRKKRLFPTRRFFDEEECYVMDAKVCGNIGRYLNHSCDPNLFVQNVFVDTHDLRFPWVVFFSSRYIPAGEELTWDYNYEVNSVPNRIVLCKCGSDRCRGRLL